MNSHIDFWRQKRALVTGGAGFLGSHVVRKLEERGCQKILVPRSPGSSPRANTDPSLMAGICPNRAGPRQHACNVACLLPVDLCGPRDSFGPSSPDDSSALSGGFTGHINPRPASAAGSHGVSL